MKKQGRPRRQMVFYQQWQSLRVAQLLGQMKPAYISVLARMSVVGCPTSIILQSARIALAL